MAFQDFPTQDTEVNIAIAKVMMIRYLAQNGGQAMITQADMNESESIEFQWERGPGYVALRRKDF